MGQIHYSFDPTSEFELKDLFSLLNKYYSYIPEDPVKLRRGINGNDSEKDRKIKELEQDINRYQKEVEKNQKSLQTLEHACDEVKEELRLAHEEIKQKDAQIKKLEEENATKYNKLQKEFTNEINNVKEEKEKEITKLNKQIGDLLKRISIYEPYLSGDVGEDKYFNFLKTNLEETMSDDAPVVGKVDAEGNAIFQFNIEKGHHKEISSRIDELQDFFEIIDRIEDANRIGMAEWGKAKYQGGQMVVTTKAKIKLTRE